MGSRRRRPGPIPRSAPAARTPAACRPPALWPAGDDDDDGQATPRAASLARSAPAGITPAGCGPTARWPAGGDNGNGQARSPAGTFVHVSAGYAHSCGLQDRWDAGLLGIERIRPGDGAGRGSLARSAPAASTVAGCRSAGHWPVGGTTARGRQRPRPGPLPRSAPASSTTARCGPMGRWPAGGPITRARPRRRPGPSPRSALAALQPAATCGRMGVWTC